MAMYALVALALVASVSANVSVDSQCPQPNPVENFDFKRYGQGKWYAIARYPSYADPTAKANCGYVKYTPEGDAIKVENYHVVNNKPYFLYGSGKQVPGTGNLGKILFTFPHVPKGVDKDVVFTILATDYENYAIGYYCKYDEEKKTHQDLAWVLSRSTKIDGEAKAFVDNFIKESEVLDSNKFYWNDFSEATCKVEA